MSEHVLDSSAMLALVLGEPGADAVRQVVRDGAKLSTVSLSEVVAKLADRGAARAQIEALLAPIRFESLDFGTDHAWQAGELRPLTRHAGLSFGDRACLAVARCLGLPVLTADRVWAELDLGVEVVVCR